MAGIGLEQVVAELGQLAGTEQGGILDQGRRADLGIAVFVSLHIQHELGDGAFQTGQLALQHHETGARQLGGAVEIHQPQLGADGVVFKRLEGEVAGGAPAAHFHVMILVRAVGHVQARQVGDRGQNGFDFLAQRLVLGFHQRDVFLQPRHLFHDGAGVAALLLDDADLLGGFVALRLHFLQAGLGGAAFAIQTDQLGGTRFQTAPGQASVKSLGIVANPFQVVHDVTSTLSGIND